MVHILVPFTSPVRLYIFRLLYRLPACQQLLTARNRTYSSPHFHLSNLFCLSQSQLDNECLHRQAQHARRCWNALGLFSSTASAGYQPFLSASITLKWCQNLKHTHIRVQNIILQYFLRSRRGMCELDHCRYSWGWRHCIFHRAMPLDRYSIFTFSVSFLQAQYLIFNQKL